MWVENNIIEKLLKIYNFNSHMSYREQNATAYQLGKQSTCGGPWTQRYASVPNL